MLREQLLKTFTNRDVPVALFDHVRGRAPDEPWPLLPILTVIAPGGSGKSALIDYLRITRCSLPNGRAALPYAYLDFTWPGVQKDLLWILVSLRNQLQKHDDGQGRHLAFPRFDLGAAIALAAPMNGNLPLLKQDEIRQSLSAGLPFLGHFGEMGNALGNIVPIIPPLIVGLKWIGKIPEVQELLLRLEKSAGWKWYQNRTTDLELPVDASISNVLLRLHDMSLPDNPGRQLLVEELLPTAFFADLQEVLGSYPTPRAWSSTANIVVFLDGFEALLNGSDAGYIGIRLLEMLTEHRKRGETDRLLLVVGSRQRLSQQRLLDLDKVYYPPLRNRPPSEINRVRRDLLRGCTTCG